MSTIYPKPSAKEELKYNLWPIDPLTVCKTTATGDAFRNLFRQIFFTDTPTYLMITARGVCVIPSFTDTRPLMKLESSDTVSHQTLCGDFCIRLSTTTLHEDFLDVCHKSRISFSVLCDSFISIPGDYCLESDSAQRELLLTVPFGNLRLRLSQEDSTTTTTTEWMFYLDQAVVCCSTTTSYYYCGKDGRPFKISPRELTDLIVNVS